MLCTITTLPSYSTKRNNLTYETSATGSDCPYPRKGCSLLLYFTGGRRRQSGRRFIDGATSCMKSPLAQFCFYPLLSLHGVVKLYLLLPALPSRGRRLKGRDGVEPSSAPTLFVGLMSPFTTSPYRMCCRHNSVRLVEFPSFISQLDRSPISAFFYNMIFILFVCQGSLS